MNLMKQETMTSREIAYLTGKMHKDVMKAIREMEDAWYEVSRRKFALVGYTDAKGESRPQYQLTKIECLYIATKFNDVARAKLIMRWEELEIKAKSLDFSDPETVLQLAQNYAAEARKVKALTAKVEVMQPVIDYVDRIEDTGATFAMDEAAKLLKLPFGRNILYQKLRDMDVIMKGRITPCQRVVDAGYFTLVHGSNGRHAFTCARVTYRGLRYISDLFPERVGYNEIKIY